MCAARENTWASPEKARPLQEERQETNARETQPSTSSSVPEGERDKRQVDVASKDQHEPVKGVDTAPTRRDTPPEVQPPVSVIESGEKCMVSSHGEGSPMARKRPHESIVDRAAQEGTSEGDKPRVAPGTKAENKAEDDDAKAASKSSAAAREVGPGTTDVEMTAAGGIASNRARETSDSTGNVGTSGTGEPPTKTVTGRRPTLKPKPNLPPDRGETTTPPPP
ncbi:hypothetical protein HPB52_021713 [Rhipicephalus sanguineus]|uniref:Uncharacterized protein n=1 Tax=Rhipicephalus sanguineus TaxID=34632 RepID=A0A9D4Q8A0_RHISA|nr:hypothetical protein HPB52_021713 [Rhipicephalus sanguineus]